jgi:hypothetical protein
LIFENWIFALNRVGWKEGGRGRTIVLGLKVEHLFHKSDHLQIDIATVAELLFEYWMVALNRVGLRKEKGQNHCTWS